MGNSPQVARAAIVPRMTLPAGRMLAAGFVGQEEGAARREGERPAGPFARSAQPAAASAYTAVSQGADNRTAPLMMPTIE